MGKHQRSRHADRRNMLRAALLAAAPALPLPAPPPPARAGAGPSPPRPAPKDAAIGKKRSLAPDASLAGSIEAKGKAAEAAGPRLDFETFRYSIEVQVSGKRREEMADLEKLVRLGGPGGGGAGGGFRGGG